MFLSQKGNEVEKTIFKERGC